MSGGREQGFVGNPAPQNTERGYNNTVLARSLLPEESTIMTAYCSACGVEVLAEAAFCHHCGQPLKERAPSSEPGTMGESVATSNQAGEVEQILWEGGYSAKAMFGGWLLAAFMTMVVTGIGMVADIRQGLFLGLLAAALCFGGTGLYVMYLKLSVHYHLTSQRFVHQMGLLHRTTDRIEVIDVDDVAFSQGLFQRVVGVGTIKIMSSDCSHSELFLDGIDRVAHVAGLIDEARRAERLRRGLFIEAV